VHARALSLRRTTPEGIQDQLFRAATLEQSPAKVQRKEGSCCAESVHGKESSEHVCPACAADAKRVGSAAFGGPYQNPASLTKPGPPWSIQAKLEIGAVDDPLEQEADRVADQVMRIQSAVSTGSAPAMPKPTNRRCAACEEAQALRTPQAGTTEDIAEAPSIAEAVVASYGQPLPDSVRRTLEPAFGYDFGHVRVHDDSRAAESARAINALAYTAGNHIVFSEGQYTPGTSTGNRLLAHELTHVVQQGAAPTALIAPKQNEGAEAEHRLFRSARLPAKLQRVHLDASGRKAFDCPSYAGDTKLEACLNDEDRLGPGERVPTVAKVQNGLLKDGADLGEDGADGVYGAATGQAVMAFKSKYHLGFEQFPDVGPGTMAKLDELCTSQPPSPTPPSPVKPTACFNTIDWPTFFSQQDADCRLAQSSIDAICQLAPNSPFNVGPDLCPKGPFEQRVEDCVADAGFTELSVTCGIPASGGAGKADIRKMYKDWLKTKP